MRKFVLGIGIVLVFVCSNIVFAQTKPKILNDRGQRTGYTKDRENVYYNGTLVEGMDPGSVVVVGQSSATSPSYLMDKSNLYFEGRLVPSVDLDTFEVMDYSVFGAWDYAKDKNSLFYKGKLLKNSDITTLERMEYGYLRDKNQVYIFGNILEGVHPDNFEIVGYGYGKYKNTVYFWNKPIKDADVNSFRADTGVANYSRDKKNYYYRGEKIEGINYKSFEIIDDKKAKDKNTLYHEGVSEVETKKEQKALLIEDAVNKLSERGEGWFSFPDSVTEHIFKKISNTDNYFEHNGRVYYRSGDRYNLVEGVNPRKFGVLLEDPKGSFYLKDNNHAYHYDTRSHSPRITLLKDVESKNFEILDDIFSPEGFYLRDSKRMYHYLTHKNGKFTALSVLSGVDPNSLEVVWTSKYRAYWKDKKHVYYLSYRNPYDGKAEHVIDVLEGADPKTFRASIEGTMGAMDKNFYFFYNYKAKKIDKNTLQKYMEGQWKYEGKDQTRVFELDETVSLRGQILMDESCL
ncbi:MAG TPA: DKNYY domain-containing protein, partial [Candidatus Gracilibacteria bacterium]